MMLLCDTQILLFWANEPARLSRSNLFEHGDPTDRLIAATGFHYRAPLISVDKKLHSIPELEMVW